MKKIVRSLVLAAALTALAVPAAFASAPSAHGVAGADWGAAVSGLAKSAPGALAGHITGK
jgi:hypothetical protein